MRRIPSVIVTMAGVFFLLNVCVSAGLAAEQTVQVRAIDDRKAVIATVEPVHELLARARIGGTITTLTIKEGDLVTAGDRIAVVADQKLALQMQALQSRVQAQQANRDQAQINFDRVQKLRASNVSSQAQLDQVQTTLDVAQRTLQALLSDRQVIQEQASQGAVLAPDTGRVLKVPVSEGSVVMPGRRSPRSRLTITFCGYSFPNGMPNSSDYFVGRFGVSYVKLKDGTEVVVQPGLPVEGGIEILAGLREGDVVITP